MFNLIKKMFWPVNKENQSITPSNPPAACKDGFDPLIYSLESPKLHQYGFDKVNVFRGWVLYFGHKVVDSLDIYFDGSFVDSFQVNLERKDVGLHIPDLPASGTCGFDFELESAEATRRIMFEVVYRNGQKEALFDYDVEYILKNQDLIVGWWQCLNSMNMPDGQTVYLTQGHDNVEEYKNSILPAALGICDYLIRSGTEFDQIRDILDFGCGSGRILKGWQCIKPGLNLYGCDYNRRLVDWNRNHLSENIGIIQNDLKPPLEYADNRFDFIYLISVFTHLSLKNQKRWINEFQRLLRPGGLLMVTLQGEFYVRNSFSNQPDKIQSFLDNGYESLEIKDAEGGNQFGSFHKRSFVEELFKDFELIGCYPQGNFPDRRNPFHVALAQDVYIFRYLGG